MKRHLFSQLLNRLQEPRKLIQVHNFNAKAQRRQDAKEMVENRFSLRLRALASLRFN